MKFVGWPHNPKVDYDPTHYPKLITEVSAGSQHEWREVFFADGRSSLCHDQQYGWDGFACSSKLNAGDSARKFDLCNTPFLVNYKDNVIVRGDDQTYVLSESNGLKTYTVALSYNRYGTAPVHFPKIYQALSAPRRYTPSQYIVGDMLIGCNSHPCVQVKSVLNEAFPMTFDNLVSDEDFTNVLNFAYKEVNSNSIRNDGSEKLASVPCFADPITYVWVMTNLHNPSLLTYDIVTMWAVCSVFFGFIPLDKSYAAACVDLALNTTMIGFYLDSAKFTNNLVCTNYGKTHPDVFVLWTTSAVSSPITEDEFVKYGVSSKSKTITINSVTKVVWSEYNAHYCFTDKICISDDYAALSYRCGNQNHYYPVDHQNPFVQLRYHDTKILSAYISDEESGARVCLLILKNDTSTYFYAGIAVAHNVHDIIAQTLNLYFANKPCYRKVQTDVFVANINETCEKLRALGATLSGRKQLFGNLSCETPKIVRVPIAHKEQPIYVHHNIVEYGSGFYHCTVPVAEAWKIPLWTHERVFSQRLEILLDALYYSTVSPSVLYFLDVYQRVRSNRLSERMGENPVCAVDHDRKGDYKIEVLIRHLNTIPNPTNYLMKCLHELTSLGIIELNHGDISVRPKWVLPGEHDEHCVRGDLHSIALKNPHNVRFAFSVLVLRNVDAAVAIAYNQKIFQDFVDFISASCGDIFQSFYRIYRRPPSQFNGVRLHNRFVGASGMFIAVNDSTFGQMVDESYPIDTSRPMDASLHGFLTADQCAEVLSKAISVPVVVSGWIFDDNRTTESIRLSWDDATEFNDDDDSDAESEDID